MGKKYKELTTAWGIAWKEEEEGGRGQRIGTKETTIQQHKDYRIQLQRLVLKIELHGNK